MKIIIGFMAMLLPLLSMAQSPPVEALNIGDAVPDIVLNEMTNYKTNAAKLSDFTSDLLLLDYWGTWCSGCLTSFPKMDSLKKEFKSVQVLLVNTKSKISKDNEQKIQNTLKRLNQRTGSDIRLPVVYNNDLLDALFPLKYIPQVVWISKNKVIAITGAEEVTAKNISIVLNGEILNVPAKKDLLSYDEHIPLFENGNGGIPRQILYRSMITGYMEGLGVKSGYRMENSKIIGAFNLNQSFLNLVKDAFRDSMKYPDNRILIESSNVRLLPSKEDPRANYYCYELVIPPCNDHQVREYMRQDLQKYFGIRVHNETRKIKCLVLRREQGAPSQKKEKAENFDLQRDSKRKFIYNEPLAFALQLLNEYSPLAIIDASNLKTNISIDLPYDLTDVKALQQAFKKSGFDLRQEQRDIEVTVISDL